jgi:hypothetical protein
LYPIVKKYRKNQNKFITIPIEDFNLK